MDKPIPDLNKCCHFYFITLSHLSSVFSYDKVEVESFFFYGNTIQGKKEMCPFLSGYFTLHNVFIMVHHVVDNYIFELNFFS